jgi:hypothetical protein
MVNSQRLYDPHFYGESHSDVFSGSSTDSTFSQFNAPSAVLPQKLRNISGSAQLDQMMNTTHRIVEQYRNRRQNDCANHTDLNPQNTTYGSVSFKSF